MTEPYRPSDATLRFYPEAAVGGYPHVDGEIEFYLRVGALVGPESRVLDLGAGRGQWAVEPAPRTRRDIRNLRGRVAEVVGCDVDPAVLDNPALDHAVVAPIGEPLPFDDDSFDLVIADYVLEHVAAEDVDQFVAEILRVLKPGGWFAARTPNKWGLIGLAARAVPNSLHTRVLSRVQPERKDIDVFPTRYAMNTRRRLRELFSGHELFVYGDEAVPTYFEQHRAAWLAASLYGRLTPRRMSSTLLVFVRTAS
ncbi:class I SAM-dependent methyltransferase [Nocardioides caeni]|uniref:class I SAM-dependent methyltransferase n=1 Tax=Nocardioides caeni TaxID=574700 RepID=UPI0013051C43|nr:class I SAM-dependent methyltransferase [Nocardioides caeni]